MTAITSLSGTIHLTVDTLHYVGISMLGTIFTLQTGLPIIFAAFTVEYPLKVQQYTLYIYFRIQTVDLQKLERIVYEYSLGGAISHHTL